jgi:hypothetical protein
VTSLAGQEFSLQDGASLADQLYVNEDVPKLPTKTVLNNLKLESMVCQVI